MSRLANLIQRLRQMSDEEVETYTERMLGQDAGNYDLLMKAALQLAPEHEKSAAVLRKLLLHRPRDAEAHANMAGVYWLLGEDGLAEQQCNEALSINPDTPRAYWLLASIYSSRGENPQKEEDMLRRVASLQPNKWSSHWNLAAFYREQGRISEAIAELKKALASPDITERDRKETVSVLSELETVETTDE